MPRVAKELSALEVKRLQHSGRKDLPELFTVGGVAGLLMQITPNGYVAQLFRFMDEKDWKNSTTYSEHCGPE